MSLNSFHSNPIPWRALSRAMMCRERKIARSSRRSKSSPRDDEHDIDQQANAQSNQNVMHSRHS
jgi:hypothetical protein